MSLGSIVWTQIRGGPVEDFRYVGLVNVINTLSI